MAFTVQTQPPTPGANAYVSVADFRAYHADRGRDLSNLTTYPDAKVQAAIVQATQYLDVRFEYVGWRYAADQTTEWPRSAAYDNRADRLDGIPRPVVQATCEYAYRALSAELLADPARDDYGKAVKSKKESVGPISESVEYADYGGFEMPAYPLADRLLTSRGLTVGNGQDNPGGLQVGNIGRG
jgi:hypothetical protein